MHRYQLILLFTLVVLACKNDESTPDIGITSRIYFCSNRTGNYEIWLKEDGQEKQITNNASFDHWWPRTMPGSNKLIFYRSPVENKNNNYEKAELCSLDPETGDVTSLIKLADYAWKAQGVANPSPDGTKLVMAAMSLISGRWHIFMTNSNGGNPTQVSKRTSFYLDPSFSPDGKQIVCTAFPEDYSGTEINKLEIHTMNTDGSNERRLTFDNFRDHDPLWSPDGTEIAFESALEPDYLGVGKWAIRTVKPDGTGDKNILHDGNINTLPVWASDAKTLYFHRLVFGGHSFRIYKINRDGTDMQQITSGTGNYDDTDAAPAE